MKHLKNSPKSYAKSQEINLCNSNTNSQSIDDFIVSCYYKSCLCILQAFVSLSFLSSSSWPKSTAELSRWNGN